MKYSTVKRKVKTVKSLLKHGVDISNPDKVVYFLNTCKWSSGTKDITIDAYRDYLNMIGLNDIKLPHIRREDKLPFIPLEEELNALITVSRPKMSIFLLLLKESAVRPIEGWRLRWIDVDPTNRNVTITPAKYSRARRLKISERLLNMILSLPRGKNYIFSSSDVEERFPEELEHFTRNFCKIRKRASKRLKNPRLEMISLKTFRHWKATYEYLKTKDIIHTKEFLGHSNIKNTLRYVHIASSIKGEEDEFICKVAKTVEEASQLIEAGFDYVCEIDGLKLFRKRK